MDINIDFFAYSQSFLVSFSSLFSRVARYKAPQNATSIFGDPASFKEDEKSTQKSLDNISKI